ncbi:hypothetical protein [Oscillatoria sp. FACHB-1406]|uniref:hypothetical protein n=1 Tax=Oscillatoria sp. FACHB-1406 TaxID=2692846 RepID=UPI0018F04611|nr:hypothetical protein [Oscillatoria sp. FACHB-1406]
MTDDLKLEFEQLSSLSRPFSAWIQRMLQPVPSQRFAHAKEALEFLQHPFSEDLAEPAAKKLKSRFFFKRQHDKLYVRIPDFSFYPSMPATGLLYALLPLAVWRIISLSIAGTAYPGFVLVLPFFIYVAIKLYKTSFYEIEIDKEKISVSFYLMNFKLWRKTHHKRDIERLDFVKFELPEWVQRNSHLDQQTTKLVINIGTKAYVVYSQNRRAMSELAQNLSEYLHLPLTSQTTYRTTEQTNTLEQFPQPHQILQLPDREAIVYPSLSATKSIKSKIKLEKYDCELRIILPYPSLLKWTFAMSTALIGGGLLGSIVFSERFLYYFLLFSPIYYLAQKWFNKSKLYEVLVNRDAILFKSNLYGAISTSSFPREQVSHLELSDARERFGDEKKTPRKSAEIVVWVAGVPFRVAGLSDDEQTWLADELSKALNVPIAQHPSIEAS